MGKAVPEERILWHLRAITSSPSYKLNNIFSAEGQILRDANQPALKVNRHWRCSAQPVRRGPGPSENTAQLPPAALPKTEGQNSTTQSYMHLCSLFSLSTSVQIFSALLSWYCSPSEWLFFFLLNGRSKICRIAWLQELRCMEIMGWCSKTPKLYIVTGEISDFFFFLEFRIAWSASYSRNPTSLSW